MKVFDASEILEFAVKIEEKGEEFYRFGAGILETEEEKKFFQFLADEEVKHKAVFEKMKSDIGSYEPAESYPGEYMEYMSAYLDNIIFPSGDWESRLSGLKDSLSVINFGIKIELDSILYYHEIKRFIPEAQHKTIDKIIEEERTHFLKLLDIKKERAK